MEILNVFESFLYLSSCWQNSINDPCDTGTIPRSVLQTKRADSICLFNDLDMCVIYIPLYYKRIAKYLVFTMAFLFKISLKSERFYEVQLQIRLRRLELTDSSSVFFVLKIYCSE